MVAIVAGKGLGLLNTSLNTIGTGGVTGDSVLGQGSSRALLNVANGNLVLQAQDGQLAGCGTDLFAFRTYNSLAAPDGDGDGWRWNYEQRVRFQGPDAPGQLAAGATVVRTDGDGNETTYTADPGRAVYVAAGDAGARDELRYDTSTVEWVWTDGTTGVTERYSNSTGPGMTGRVLRRKDSSGNDIALEYDAGRLTTIKDSLSQQELRLAYGAINGHTRVQRLNAGALIDDANGHATTALGELVRLAEYDYDGDGRLTAVTRFLAPAADNLPPGPGFVTSYSYDGASTRIATVAQSDGTTASFTYDAAGRVSAFRDQGGTGTQLDVTYGPQTNSTGVTNGEDLVWTYRHDPATGALTGIVAPPIGGTSPTTAFGYDSAGNLTSITDANQHAVTFECDGAGNRALERDAIGNTTRRTFGALNQMLSETRHRVPDPDGAGPQGAGDRATTRYVYDANARLRFVVSAEGRVTENRYGAPNSGFGLMKATVLYLSQLFDVTALGPTQQLSETDLTDWVAALPDRTQVQLTEYRYDLRGNMDRQTSYATVSTAGAGILDAHAGILEFSGDAYSLLRSRIAVRGVARDRRALVSSFEYDGMTRQVQSRDASGLKTTAYDDAAGRVIISTATGLTETRQYDSSHRLARVSQTGDGTARNTRYVHDATDQLRMVEDAQQGRRYRFYDPAGRLAFTVDALGSVTGFERDAAGQLTRQTQYANRADTGSWYDAVTDRVSKSDLAAGNAGSDDVMLDAAHDRATTHVYDGAGRRIESTDAAGTATVVSYDGLSRVIMTQTGDRVTRYLYDKDGCRVGVVDALGYLTEHRHDAGGRLIETVSYGQPSPAAPTMSATVWNDVTDLSAWRPAVTAGALHSSFFHDGQGRVIGAVDEQQGLTESVYDEEANTLQTLRFPVPVTVVPGDDLGSVRSRAGAPFQLSFVRYDDFGRVLETSALDGSVTRHDYDDAGHLVRVVSAAGTSDERIATTSYNAFGEITATLGGEGSAWLGANPSPQRMEAAIHDYGIRYDYDSLGRKVRSVDANGNSTFFYYDLESRQTLTINVIRSALNVAGEVSETTYDSFGQAAATRRYAARLVDPTALADGGGLASPSLLGKLAALVDTGADQVTLFEYDRCGRLVRQVVGENGVTESAYTVHGELAAQARSTRNGATTTAQFDYDGNGRLLSQTEDVGGINARTTNEYDAFRRVVRTVDPSGRAIIMAYENGGRSMLVTDALQQTKRTDFDVLGRVIRQSDPLGGMTGYTYDHNARAVTVTSPEGRHVTTVRGRHGETRSVTDARGNVTRYEYNADGQPTTVTDALGRVIARTTYDKSGRRFETTDACGTASRFGYDQRNRVVEQRVDPNGLNLTALFAFDALGQQIAMTEAAGTAAERVTTFQHDRNGRATRTDVDAAGGGLDLITVYRYDDLDDTVAIARGTASNPDQYVMEYEFDNLRRRVKDVVAPGSRDLETQYRYDAAGRLTRRIDPNGQSMWYVYDPVGRLAQTISALGEVAETRYDAAGRVVYTHSYLERLSPVTVAGFGDDAGTLVLPGATPNDGRRHVLYDADRQPRCVLQSAGANGWTVAETRYDGNGNALEVRAYDTFLPEARVAALASTGSPGIALAEIQNELRNTLGYRDEEPGTLERVPQTFLAYDAANRLRFTVDPTGAVVETVSDAAGNRMAMVLYAGRPTLAEHTEAAIDAAVDRAHTGNRATHYAYDAASRPRYTVDASNSVTGNAYDARGNIITTTRWAARPPLTQYGEAAVTRALSGVRDAEVDQVTHFVYDAGNRLRFAVDASGAVAEHTYDAVGNLVETIRFAQQPTIPPGALTEDDLAAAVAPLRSDVGNQVSRFAYDGAKRLRFTVDALGSVTENVSDRSGNLIASIRFAVRPALAAFDEAAIAAAVEPLSAHPGNGVNRAVYDALNRLRFTVDALGGVSERIFDASGRVVAAERFAARPALAQYTEATIDAAVAPARGQAGNRIEHRLYDGLSRVRFTAVRVSLGAGQGGYQVTALEVNALGQTGSSTSYAAAMTLASIDETTILAALGNGDSFRDRTTRYLYDLAGRQVYRLDAASMSSGRRTYRVSALRLDALGQTAGSVTYAAAVAMDAVDIASVDAAVQMIADGTRDRVSAEIVDALGQPIYVLRALGDGSHQVLKQEFDTFGRTFRTTQYVTAAGALADFERTSVEAAVGAAAGPGDREVQYVYDRAGRQRFVLQADQDGHWGVGESRYDVVGNVAEARRYDQFLTDAWIDSLEATRPTGARETDVAAQLAAQGYHDTAPGTLAAIQRTRFAYDRQNRVRFTIDALGTAAENVYDPLGNLSTTIRYATRPALAQFSEGAVDAAVDRTDAGNLVQHSVYDSLGQSRFDLQDFEPNTGTTGRHGVTERRYDALGQLVDTRAYAATVGHLDAYDEQTVAAAVVADDANDRHAVIAYDEVGRHIYGLRGLRVGSEDRYVVTKQVHDALGQLTQQIEFAAVVALTQFDAASIAGALVPDASNDRITTHVYDAGGRMRFEIRADLSCRERLYDAIGQLIEARAFEFAWPGHDGGTEADMSVLRGSRAVGDGVTRGQSHVYDAAGRCVQITDAAGQAEHYRYDALGARIQWSDKNGKVWRCAYDRLGRRRVETTPPVAFTLRGEDGAAPPPERVIHTRYVYNAFNNLVSKTDAANFDSEAATTDYLYDTLGRPIGTLSPGFYDPATGTVERDPGAGRFRREASIVYDALGNAVRTGARRSADGFDFTYRTYSARTQVVHEINALNHVTRYTCNAFAEPETVTRHSVTIRGTPLNGLFWTAGEIEPQMNYGVDEVGHTLEDVSARTIRLAYDTLGRKTAVTLPTATYYSTQMPGDSAQANFDRLTPEFVTGGPDAQVTVYEYSAFGDPIRQRVRANTAEEWQDTSFVHDVMGRRIRSVDAAGFVTSLSCDMAGNLVFQNEAVDDPPGTDRSTAFVYDILDRQVRVDRYRLRYTDASGNHGAVTWTYANGGEWLDPDAQTATTVRTTTFDPYGRPLTVTDAAGNLVTMRYDALGRLADVVGPAVTIAPPAANAEDAVDPFRNQVSERLVTSMTLDVSGHAVRQVRATLLGQDLREIRQAYDAGGNLVSTTDAEGFEKRRACDHAGRVIRETQEIGAELGPLGINDQGIERRYAYDALGQLTDTLDVYVDGTDRVQSGKSAAYNPFGEVTEERRKWGPANLSPDALNMARVARHDYDNAGHVFDKVAVDGLTLYFYNLLGQVTREEKRGNTDPTDHSLPRASETQYDMLGRAVMVRRQRFDADVTFATGTTVRTVTPYLRRILDRWGNVIGTDEGGYELINGQPSYPQQRIFTSYQYDSNNRQVAESLMTHGYTGPNGLSTAAQISRITYRDVLGNAIKEVDEAREPQSDELLSSRTRRKDYDAAGRVIAEIDATQKRLEYAYNIHGDRLGTRNARGTVLFNRYDRNGNVRFHGVLRTTSPSGGGEYDSHAGTGAVARTYLNAYLYDQVGRRIASKTFAEEANAPWAYTWLDGRGLGVRQGDVMGVVVQRRFDPFGNKAEEIDGANIRSLWNAATVDYTVGRVETYHQPVDGGTRLGSYIFNRFSEVKVHAVGNTMTQYDRLRNGLVSEVTITPDVTHGNVRELTRYAYDVRGQLTMEGRFDSDSIQTRMISYDHNGRLARVEQSKAPGGATCDVSYAYDEWSNVRRVRASYTHAGVEAPSSTESWYDFDHAGRMTMSNGALAGGTLILKMHNSGSVRIRYDSVGRRSGITEHLSHNQSSHVVLRTWDTMRDEQYEYDDLGHLRQIQQRVSQINVVLVDLDDHGHHPAAHDTTGPWRMLSSRSVNLRGDVLRSEQWSRISSSTIANEFSTLLGTTISSYRADGQVASTQTDAADPKNSTSTLNSYNPQTGQLGSYVFHAVRSDGEPFMATFDYRHTFQNGARVVSSIRDLFNGLDTFKNYDLLGRLIAERVDLQKPNGAGSDRYEQRNYRYGADGRAIFKHAELRLSASGPGTVDLPTPTAGEQTYVYAGNRLVGTIGTLRLANATKFDFAYTPMSEGGGSGNSRYVVQNGDSLIDIALSSYGDGGLWYLVADANGVTSDPAEPLPVTEVGKAYDIPDAVRSSHTASTYMPFGMGEVVGNDRPLAIPPPPPPKHSDIEIMAVAAVSITLQIGATIVLTELGVPAPIAYGIGAALGNLGNQSTSWALGMQQPGHDGIDWSDVGVAGAEGAVFSAMGSYGALGRELWHQAEGGFSAWTSGSGPNWSGIAGSVFNVGFDALGPVLGGPRSAGGAFNFSLAGLINSAYNPSSGWAIAGGGRSPVVGAFEFAYGGVASGLVNVGYSWIRERLDRPTPAASAARGPRSVDHLGAMDAQQIDEYDAWDRVQVAQEDWEALRAQNARTAADSDERIGWLLQTGAMADRIAHFGEDINDRALIAAARRQLSIDRAGRERAAAAARLEARRQASVRNDEQMRAPKVDPKLVEYLREMDEAESMVLQDMYRSGYYIHVSRATNVDGLVLNRSDGILEATGPLSMPGIGMGDDLRSILLMNSRALEGEEYVAPQEIIEIHDLNTPAAQSRRGGVANVQTFSEFSRTYKFTHGTTEGVEQEFLKYHNQQSDRIVENWRRIDNAGAAVNLIARGTLLGIQFIVDPVGTIVPLVLEHGTEKVLTTVGVDADTAAMVGQLTGMAFSVGRGLKVDPVGTAVSLAAGDAITLGLKAVGVGDQDASLLGGAIGTGIGFGRTFGASRRSPVQEILRAQRLSRADIDAARLMAAGREFEMSKGLRISEDVTLYRGVPPQARAARPADGVPAPEGAAAGPRALLSAPVASASGGVPATAGVDYYAPGVSGVVPYEATPMRRFDDGVFSGDFAPRSRLVASMSGGGEFSGGKGPAMPEALAVPRTGQLLLAAPKARGRIIDSAPSAEPLALVTGRSGLERFGSDAFRRRVEPYVDAVRSNRPWTWKGIGLGWLDGQEKEVVRLRAAEVGLIPKIPVDFLTGSADFSSVLVEEQILPEDLWLSTDDAQFRYLNDLIGGQVPGTTWHHHELPGWMQLLPFGIHAITGHFGGRSEGEWSFARRK